MHFLPPPTPDVLIKFVNDLGYPKVVRTLSDVVTNDMFQPWRALITIINLGLTGKTSGFERPRAPVLQILWGVGKKKATLIVIPSVRFTKLAIHHLQSKHKFHPRPEVSDPDSPAPKPAKVTKPKATKKSNPLAPKAASVTKPVAVKAPKTTASRPPKPTPATTEPSKKDQSKKRKMVKESSEGPLPPVLIREPESRKFQPLPEVQGKGKDKVGEEQAAQVLLNLQTPKKKSPTDQYIFQRRSSAPTEPSGHDESSSLYAELGLTDSETESDEEVPGIDARDQDKGQAGPNSGIQDEGQDGSNPGDVAVSQPQPSHVVHAGPNLEHIDVEENLKLPVNSINESNSYKAYEDHKKLYEALEKSIDRDHTDQLLTDMAEARKKKKKRHDSPKTPPGSLPHQPPPPPPPSDQSTSTAAPSSSKTAASAEYMAWTTTDTRLKLSISSIPEDLHMDDDTAPDEQVHSSGDEYIGHDHIPMVNLK
ncbi:hypothetical protein Tco_0195599, partial [Tanacetum coccineum]